MAKGNGFVGEPTEGNPTKPPLHRRLSNAMSVYIPQAKAWGFDGNVLKLNKWSHLKLRVHDNIFSFSINENQVMGPIQMPNLIGVAGVGHFPDFRTGGIGFGVANYTARFDNITVTGDSVPNSGGFTVTPSGKLATTWGNLKRF